LSVLPKILPFWLVVANKKRFILLLMLRHIWKNGLILIVWSPANKIRPFTMIIFKLDGLCWLTCVAFPGTWPGCSQKWCWCAVRGLLLLTHGCGLERPSATFTSCFTSTLTVVRWQGVYRGRGILLLHTSVA
jgi:hypothetical protein